MKTHKLFLLASAMFCGCVSASADPFEDAQSAVKNIKVGWNLGNTLESNSGNANSMWIEAWSDKSNDTYETAWGQPVTTRQLIHLFKLAGFNAIRVPVTWYPHMGTLKIDIVGEGDDKTGVWDKSAWTEYNVNEGWMARVREVVDYVIDEGMYCILNVHHDTGDASTAWVIANENVFKDTQERYESLWTQIANEFESYDEHLLFEGYNEMLDEKGSWCFASFNTDNRYDANIATSAYKGVNSYAQSFVNTVRATGGNNTTRNLILCTYGGCDGSGNWNSHLSDPLTNMALPEDIVDNHLIFEVHSYWDTNNFNDNLKSSIDAMFNGLTTYLANRAPVIIGEWGSSSSGFNYNDETQREKAVAFAEYFESKAKENNMATFWWMGLVDGKDRTIPQWTQTEIKDAILKGYYGENIPSKVDDFNSDDSEISSSDIYSILGVKINANIEELPKGFYIIGGKKAFIDR